MVKRKVEDEKVKPRTKRAKRILEKREPKLVCLPLCSTSVDQNLCFSMHLQVLPHDRSRR